MSTALRCPYCGSYDNAVLNSRPRQKGETIRRCRECRLCRRRWHTVERVVRDPSMENAA